MRVLFFPISDKNPYQRLLASSLKDMGVEVSFIKGDISLRSLVFGQPSFDVLHLHWTPVDFPRKILLFTRLLLVRAHGKKIVWTVHNLVPHDTKATFSEIVFLRFVARLVNRIIVLCPGAVDTVSDLYRVGVGKISFTCHGNYIGVYKFVEKQRAREKLSIPKDKIVFLYFGLIRRYKGVPDLIKAFKGLRGDAVLIIAGRIDDCKLLYEIKSLARRSSKVILRLGYVSDDDLSTLIGASDFVTLPFKDILVSSSSILSLSLGRATIAPKIGCLPFYLSEESNILYNPENSNGLEDALKRALDADAEKWGVKNLKFAKTTLTWSKAAKETKEVYKEVLK